MSLRGFAAVGILLAAPSAWAQDLERIAPRDGGELSLKDEGLVAVQTPLDAGEVSGDDAVIVERIVAVVFRAGGESVAGDAMAGTLGVVADEVENFPRTARTVADGQIGKPLSMVSLNRLVRDLVVAYRAADRPVVDVVVPEQNVTAGVLQLVVIEGRLGKVRVEGAEHFSGEKMAGDVRLREGEPIRHSVLLGDLEYLNRSPFRQVQAVYQPSESGETGVSDVVLRVEDRRPWQLFSGYENSGTAVTGEDRWLVGGVWGNAFGMEQVASYQYTTDLNWDNLHAHVAAYEVPLKWRHRLRLLGAFVDTRSVQTMEGESLALGGESVLGAAYYSMPLPATAWFSQEVETGVEFKGTNNNLEFGGSQVFDTTTEVYQLVLRHKLRQSDRFGATRLTTTGYWSPGGLSGHNSDAVYGESRAGAKANYLRAALQGERVTRLPGGFRLETRADGQISDGNLLPSEQLGLGGRGSVRGWEPWISRGDLGATGSVEIHTPEFGLPGGLPDKMELFAFYDLGYARNKDRLPAEESALLQGAGVGLGYRLADNVRVRGAYGWQLDEDGVDDGEDGRFHVDASVSW